MTKDAAQQAVVDADPLASGVVIGAPGTGKTRTLVRRVERLLSDGSTGTEALRPEHVLVLTPNRQAATALRDRIGVRITQATPGPLARSLGSFAFQIVRGAMVQAGFEPPALLTGADQDRILAELLAGDIEDQTIAWPPALSPPVRMSKGFRSELRAFLDECTELGADSAELRALGNDVWRAAADLADEYRGVLDGMRFAHRDAADLLAEAASTLRVADAVALGPLGSLRAVLIDDAQELTRGGIAVVRALRARGIAVFAFGDPDISSGAFRGASPELFTEVASVLGQEFVLDGPHRQHPSLTDLTRTVTAAIGAAGRVDHRRPPRPEHDRADGAAVSTSSLPRHMRSSTGSPGSSVTGTSAMGSLGTGWRSSHTTPGRSPSSRRSWPAGRSRHGRRACSVRWGASPSSATSSAWCGWRSPRRRSAPRRSGRRR